MMRPPKALLTLVALALLLAAAARASAASNPAVTTISLPDAEVTKPYSATLTAAGGTTPYTWSLNSGNLPPGLTLSSTGAISGAPTSPDNLSFRNYFFQAKVTDAVGLYSVKQLVITVYYGGPQIATPSLPDAEVAKPYSATLTANGGTTPYTWSLDSGGLPPGLTLSTSTGAVSGTPTSPDSLPFHLYVFGVKATDAMGRYGVQLVSLKTVSAPVPAQNAIIATVAGTTWIFRSSGGPAVSAPLGTLNGVAVDPAGNIFAADYGNNLVVKIAPNGVLTVVAGNGIGGISGDGGPATSASLLQVADVALDAAGNLYIADFGNSRVRKVSTSGIITTVAGAGEGFSGDGGPATAALLRKPSGVAVGADGSVYLSDTYNNRIRKVSPGGIITTVVGNGTQGFSGDGGPAIAAALWQPQGLAFDRQGNLYIADSSNNRIRKVDLNGTITTVAGGGSATGEGGLATAASLNWPAEVTVDTSDNIYIVDSSNNRVRKVAGGIITTVAGSGISGFSGDDGQATAATFSQPRGVAIDALGNLYIADNRNLRIRRVATTGIVTTVAGNGLFKFSGDGGPALAATLNYPTQLSIDGNGNLYLVDSANQRIRKLSSSGILTTVAGTGMLGFYGDGGPAASALLRDPYGVAVDSAGNVYFSDTANVRIRKVSTNGSITTVAGNGSWGFSGDGGQGVNAKLALPWGLAFDASGNLLIADADNNRIRKLTPAGIITTFAGNGTAASSGDGGPATNASLNWPNEVAVDSAGNVFISEHRGVRVRKVSTNGTITTVAGNGTFGSSGDGGPATSASLNQQRGLAIDGIGNLYIADSGNCRIRKVTSGIITTLAGTICSPPSGDGGPASQAVLNFPSDVVVDAGGSLYIADSFNDRIRKVLATAPTFTATPAKLSFSVAAGAVGDAPQRIALIPGGVFGLAWTAQAQSGGNWLSLSPGSGLIPDSIGVTANATTLAAGTYQGTVMVQAPMAVPSTQTVTVELTVTTSLPAQLAVEPGSLTFEAHTGAANSPSQTLRISNSGGGTLNWTAAAAGVSNWLSLSPSSGSATAGSPSALRVSANLSGLAAGAYSGAVTVSSGSQTVKVGVTLLVSAVTQTILVSQAGLLFTGVQDGGAVPPQSIGILNTGQGTMNWTVEATTLGGGNWLTVTPTSGSSDASSTEVQLVEVGADTTGLAAGRYSGMIRVRSTGANNSPQIASVELNVLAAGMNPGVLVRPTGLIFAARAGSSSPASQTVKLGTAAAGTFEARSGLLTWDGGNWLQALPQNLVLSSSDRRTVTVQPTLGTMTSGLYHGVITFLFDDGTAHTVQVLFLVVPAATSSSSGLSLLARDEGPMLLDGTCTPTKLLAVHRTLGAGFSAPTGSPTLIEVQVTDDCATVITDATVTASFSSGDPLLVMTSLRNGTYVGTWRPLTTASQVTVTVRATLPPLTTAEVQAQGQVSGSSTMPLLFNGGIVNAASYAPAAALAPGSIVAAFGRSMATGVTTSGLPLEQTLGGATLNIGGIEAPLFFSSDGQINAQLPFNLTPNSRPQAYIRLRTTSGAEMISVPEPFTIAAAQPGIFTMNQAGTGQGAIIDNATWKLVDASNPAKAGDWLQVYATGLGQVTPSVTAGQAAPGNPPSETTVRVTATVGGQAATVIFAGLAPGFAGLYQVNLQIPEGVTSGDAVPLILTQGGVSSNTATLAIR